MIYFFLVLCLLAVVGMSMARRALAKSAERADARRELAARARYHAAAGGRAEPVTKLMSDAEELSVLDERIWQLEARRDWSELAAALEERALLVTGTQRVDTLVRALLVYRDHFAHSELARETAEAILELDPEHEEALAITKKRSQP